MNVPAKPSALCVVTNGMLTDAVHVDTAVLQ